MASGYTDLLKKLGAYSPRSLTAPKLPGQGKSFIYPSDLFSSSNPPYIIFVRRDSVARDAKVLSKMALYMPPNISVNYGTSWEDIELNWYQYGDKMMDAFGIMKNVDFAEAGRVLAAGAANIADSVTGTDFVNDLEVLYTRRTKNPHQALLFKGVKFREFKLEFNLMARNAQESNSIRDLIKEFKLAAHPTRGTSGADQRMLYFPDNFDIFFMTPASEYMFNILTCGLSDINVEYAGSGIPSFFNATGAPVHIKLSLDFKEFEPLTRERIEENY